MELLKKWYEQFRPKRWYSWQTSIWLSGISGILSLLATLVGKPLGLIATLIAYCGWFFLIGGTSWYAKEYYSDFAPWITGAILCIFFFGNFDIENWGWAVAIWPIISAIIYGLPYFWDESLQKKIPGMGDRVTILVVFGTQLLASFWIQFFIVLTNFIEEYPSFYSDDLSNSLFIVRTPSRRLRDPRGVFILDLLDVDLVEHYEGKPWGEVDAEMILDPSATTNQLFNEVLTKITPLKEDQYWLLQAPIAIPAGNGYNLILQYEWTGPQARLEDDYLIEKTCTLTPVMDTSPQQRGQITAIACQPSQVRGWLEK